MNLLSTLRARMGGFAGKSIFSLLVKVSGAFAGYLFFLVFANRLGAEQFGLFAFALSIANFAMLAAGFGQPMLMLRNMTYALADKDMAMGRGVLRFGLRATGLGALTGAAGIAIFGLIAPLLGAPSGLGLYAAAMGLLVPLVAAELLASLQRVSGVVVMAIAPKDLLWRLLSIVALLGLGAFGLALDAVGALWLAAGVLVALAFWQGVDARRRLSPVLRAPEGGEIHRAKMRKASLHFWGIAVASGLAQHLTVVAVGFRGDPETIGAFFAAFRTASLLAMPLTAANIVLAPMIARHHKEARRDLIQKVIVQFIMLATLPTLVGLVILAVWGREVLGLFDPSFGMAYPALLVFALSFLVNTVTGPCGYMMMMSGAEAKFLRYTLVTNLAGVVGAAVAIGFGMIWAAAAIGLASATQNLLAARWSRRHAGVEATIACLWKKM
ncbi:MAG: lipopolysaccharide biosynthesis protein [Pseudomonadota bacterium]|nr:lipopolysaccharide biosynthesis protein [Pseudomonadota bacterium]